MTISLQQLTDSGASPQVARRILDAVAAAAADPEGAWRGLTDAVLGRDVPFAAHKLAFDAIYRDWDRSLRPPPSWFPTADETAASNIRAFSDRVGVGVDQLFRWTVDNRAAFWQTVIETLDIRFRRPPSAILDPDSGLEAPRWLAGSEFNIAESCFNAPSDATSIVYQAEGGPLKTLSYGDLERLSNRVANSIGALGLGRGDAVAIAMPMTVEAVAAYLGIVKAGCVVVSIADSFAPEEIATRLRIADALAVVTQDVILRAGKTLPMYEKVVAAGARLAIVIPATGAAPSLRDGDLTWSEFLVEDDAFTAIACGPDDTTNVLFSSGTTGDPKAIPWTHTTPIKCAADGLLHHDIHPGDVVAWPTNIGWMMGPWLIYASLCNGGTIALYYGAPTTREFCRFVRDAGVHMLGVVPSLVKAWRTSGAVDGIDWSGIKVFSSTGEASNPEDYLFLSSLAGYRPVIEYCGGTEIGGGYVSGTVVQPASPSTFSTPCFGLDFVILDEDARPAKDGELFLIPPSIGLSTRLLNKDHHEVYFEGTPAGPNGELLRRHGDQVGDLGGGYYRAEGRADDTMNLGGIKVSSAEIERTVSGVDGVVETAAIAVEPTDGGPSRLVIFTVTEPSADVSKERLAKAMQRAIAANLNPLFKIYDVALVDALPRTASNKVMRRVLREGYTG